MVRLPRLSNFTDFNPLERVEEAAVRYVQTPGELGNPDLVILPGTKSTLDDLKWLRQSGLEAKILQYASRGGAVAGICGGYQMLGQTLSDPEGVEGGGTLRGMGLLPTGTVFRGRRPAPGLRGLPGGTGGLRLSERGGLEGYEIHMGETVLSQGAEPLTALATLDGGTKADGAARGNVWGRLRPRPLRPGRERPGPGGRPPGPEGSGPLRRGGWTGRHTRGAV